MSSNIVIENVTKIYDEIKALDSITLNFEANRVVSLVGVNGSGKTTLLRILAGLEEATKGCVKFDNERIKAQDLRQISTLVFQKAIMFNSNVQNNVAFGLKIRNFDPKEIERRTNQALSTVRLYSFHKRKSKKLSTGEQQRVALARAFVIEPKILLLDEPTSNLDPTNAVIIEDAIKKMREKNGCTIILATHNLHQAKRLSNNIVHIHFGKILETAKPKDFFENPGNKITKKFINGDLQF
ncbi:MAG: ATP-binding cassette domain-containing protein [Candidatus Bathyarchaeota archaeon]|nr:ATP-binding cassette domain-containing protein [Candidatus Bathyarchaeota archaeon]